MVRERVSAWHEQAQSLRKSVVERLREKSLRTRVLSALHRMFVRPLPPLAITHIQPPTLVVLMAGTSIEQYDRAGQFGRLASSLERHRKYFRTVLFMTADRRNYTGQIGLDGVRHISASRLLPTLLPDGVSLLLSGLLRFRTMRKVTSVVILDEESATAGWLIKRLSSSQLALSSGAPWAPPRRMDIGVKRRWLVRAALRRLDRIVVWPSDESDTVSDAAAEGLERNRLPDLVDADLFCPLTTTDPARPRTIGAFMSTGDEADARVMMGVGERLIRRNPGAVLRVLLSGHDAEVRASALQSEVAQRGIPIEFQVLPPAEMLPDAIARLRMCLAFSDPESVRGLLRAMSSGVPGIIVRPSADEEGEAEAEVPGWSHFVLNSSPTQEEITRNIETLFREPGVRLRMAREGRRFVVAKHSLKALAAEESKFLLGQDLFEELNPIVEPEFDPDAEAEKLAQMLEGLGVTRTESQDAEGLEAAA